MFEKVEQAVCEVYRIDCSKLYKRDAKKITSSARSLTWYVLHCDNSVSISALSKRYGRTERNVKYMIAKIKFLIGRNKEITQKYYNIKQLL